MSQVSNEPLYLSYTGPLQYLGMDGPLRSLPLGAKRCRIQRLTVDIPLLFWRTRRRISYSNTGAKEIPQVF